MSRSPSMIGIEMSIRIMLQRCIKPKLLADIDCLDSLPIPSGLSFESLNSSRSVKGRAKLVALRRARCISWRRGRAWPRLSPSYACKR